MRILFISNMYPSTRNPSYGIFVKNSYDIIKEHYDVKLVAIKKYQGILAKVAAYIVFYLKTVISGIGGRYDCIYAHYISHCELPVRIIKSFHRDIVIVGNVHGEDVFSDFGKYKKNMIRAKRFMDIADYIIAPSQYFKEKINKVYGFCLEKIYVSPSGGVNTKIFFPDDQIKCREYLGFDPGAYYIGYVSRIEKGKGWDTFLRAFYNILGSGVIKNVKAVIVGDGSEEAELKELVRSMGIENYVKFYPLVSQQELHYLYNSFSLFCFPTRRQAESLGLVGLEAMACGLPCVIANAGGPMSYAHDGQNALVFNKNSVKDLEKRIMEYYNMNSDKLQMIKDAAYKTAQMYSYFNVKKQIINFFEKVEKGNG